MRGVLLVLVVVLAGSGAAEAKRIACQRALDAVPQFAPRRDDLIPPATPVIRDVTIEGHTLYINATFSPDTAYVHVTVRDARSQRFELWTTPDKRFVCTHHLDIALGDALITVAAIDAGGLAGDAIWPVTVRSESSRHFRCGTGMMGLLLLVPISVVGLAIALLIVTARRRSQLRLPGDPVVPLVAESIVRTALHETLFAVVCTIVLIGMLYVSDDEAVATVVAVFPFLKLFRIARCRRILRALDAGATAELHRNLLATGGHYVHVSTRIITAAQAQTVPTSIVRSND